MQAHSDQSDAISTRKPSVNYVADAPEAEMHDDEIFHTQADGFWGPERGFHDVERLWRQRQQQN
jgi:hypothetical protein